MNRFTIDADFISLAGLDDNADLLLDVLMVFTQDNEFRLCLDSSDIAFQKYLDISLNSEAIRFWFHCLFESRQSRKYIDYITINRRTYSNGKQIYIEICNNSCSEMKRIIVAEKQSYNELIELLSDSKIQLLDGYQAKAILNMRNIQISMGANSPNINGNYNTVNK
jgi:hypothetical protein